MLRWGKQIVGILACGLILAVGCYMESDIEQVNQVPVKDPNATKTAAAGARPPSKAFDTESKTSGDPGVDQTEKATRDYSDRVARSRSAPGEAGSERVTTERFGSGTTLGKTEPRSDTSKVVASAAPDANKRAVHVDSDSPELGRVRSKDAARTATESFERPIAKLADSGTAFKTSRVDDQTVTPPELSQRFPIEKKGAEGQAPAIVKPADSGTESKPLLSIADQKVKAVEVPSQRFPIEVKTTGGQASSVAKPADRVTAVTPPKADDRKTPPLELPGRLPSEKKSTEVQASSDAKPAVLTPPAAATPVAPQPAPAPPPRPVVKADSGASAGEKRAIELPDLLAKPTAKTPDAKPVVALPSADRSTQTGLTAKPQAVDRKESLPVPVRQGESSPANAPMAASPGGFVVPKPPDVPSEPAKSRSILEEKKQGAMPAATPKVEAKTVGQAKPISPEPARSAQPNQPAGTASSGDADMKTVISQRLKEVQANPNDLEKQLALRLLYVVDNQPEKALAEIPGTNAPTQAIIQRLMKTVMNASQSKGKDSAAGATQMLDSVEDLRKLLRSHADLQLPAIKLCTKVEGFGVYDEIKPPVFPAGQRNRLIVYCEIRNFRTDPTEDGRYRVLLAQRIKVLNSEGKVVYEVGDDDVPYTSRRPIEDFFLVQLVELPTALSQGKYLLRLYAEDKLAGKATENQVEFTIKGGTANR